MSLYHYTAVSGGGSGGGIARLVYAFDVAEKKREWLINDNEINANHEQLQLTGKKSAVIASFAIALLIFFLSEESGGSRADLAPRVADVLNALAPGLLVCILFLCFFMAFRGAFYLKRMPPFNAEHLDIFGDDQVIENADISAYYRRGLLMYVRISGYAMMLIGLLSFIAGILMTLLFFGNNAAYLLLFVFSVYGWMQCKRLRLILRLESMSSIEVDGRKDRHGKRATIAFLAALALLSSVMLAWLLWLLAGGAHLPLILAAVAVVVALAGVCVVRLWRMCGEERNAEWLVKCKKVVAAMVRLFAFLAVLGLVAAAFALDWTAAIRFIFSLFHP